MDTETLDKFYLEWSQFTKARNSRELRMMSLLQDFSKQKLANELTSEGYHSADFEGAYDSMIELARGTFAKVQS